jgi:hypothetical protein
MKTAPLLIVILFLSLPLITAQAPVPPPAEEQKRQPPPAPQGMAMIGFQKGEYPIPINGTSIPVYIDETLWLSAREDTIVALGIKGQRPSLQLVKKGNDIQLEFPKVSCCGNTLQLELTASDSFGSKVERANIILVGEERLNEIDAQTSVSPEGIVVTPKGSAKTPINQIALLKAGADGVSVGTEYGSIKYKNVIKQQSIFKITYEPSQIVDRTTFTAYFIIESPRVYSNEGPRIAIIKNGTIVSIGSRLNQSGDVPITVNLNVPQVGSPGKGGDTPLRQGLNFLHFYLVDDDGNIKGNTYLPLYLLDDDNFTVLDHSSKSTLSLPLTSRPPVKLIAYASTSINGITTSTASKEILLPISRITVTSGQEAIADYSLSVEPDVPKTNVQGTTYLLSSKPEITVTLTKIKVNNFTVSEFRINGSATNSIKFPQDVQVIAKVGQLRIEATDEFGDTIIGGVIKIRKEGEAHTRGLGKSQAISLPNGAYTLEVMVAGNLASTQTVAIDSAPQTVTLVLNRLSLADRGFTVAVLGEIIAVIALSAMLIGRLRARKRKPKKEEEIDEHGIPLRHVD